MSMRRVVLFTAGILILSLVLSARPALAGQTVVINDDVNDAVYDNGEGPNGTNPGGSGSRLDPNNNTVILNSGTVTFSVYGSGAYNPSGSATATGNSVTINGGGVGNDVYGGMADAGNGSATAAGNSVTINSGRVVNVYGGRATIDDASDSATATGNRVTINGGEVDTNVYGGYPRLATRRRLFLFRWEKTALAA